MLRPAQTGRLLSQSFRLASSQSTTSLRASQLRLPSRYVQPVSTSTRTFASYPNFQQQATAAVENDEVRHAPPELTQFSDLAEQGIVHPNIIKSITGGMKIHTMTDVQRLTINECLDGTDVIAQARTGTGKTLAFLMPIIQRLMKDPTLSSRPGIEDTRALIISPTRELAEQIAVEARKVVANTHIQVQTAVGGTGKSHSLASMRQRGVHILVGTPGRMKDLLSDPYSGLKLDKIQTFVLDEADRLLDIGFAPDIAEISSYMPHQSERARQTLMFSATVPRSVVDLVRQTLRPDFKFIRTVDPDEQPTHERIPQNVVFLPGLQNQVPAITEIAMNAIEANKNDPDNNPPFKGIIFLDSKAEVTLIKQWLENLRGNASDPGAARRGFFGSHPLAGCRILEMSGNLQQNQRTFNSDAFRRAESALLVASDVVARGMDFPNVSHVIQMGLPKNEDSYIHRVGRTGRAGKSGQGWLLLQEDDRRQYDYSFARHLKLKKDDTLHTAKLDMTKGAQLPANIAKLMQYVENGVRSVPFDIKSDAYVGMIGALKQSPTKRSAQQMIDMLNEYSRYGWGLEKPPPMRSSFAAKMGFSGVRGLEIEDGRMSGPPSRGMDRGGRSGYDSRDPFGQGMGGGRSVGRGFGGGERGGFGGGRDRGFGGGRDRGYGGGDRGRRDPFGDDGGVGRRGDPFGGR